MPQPHTRIEKKESQVFGHLRVAIDHWKSLNPVKISAFYEGQVSGIPLAYRYLVNDESMRLNYDLLLINNILRGFYD